VEIPIIEKRKIYEAKKHGYSQFVLTLPKAFAETLKADGEDSLVLVYNGALLALPANSITKDELLEFLKLHLELERLLKDVQKRRAEASLLSW